MHALQYSNTRKRIFQDNSGPRKCLKASQANAKQTIELPSAPTQEKETLSVMPQPAAPNMCNQMHVLTEQAPKVRHTRIISPRSVKPSWS